jgi:hypothetical protein
MLKCLPYRLVSSLLAWEYTSIINFLESYFPFYSFSIWIFPVLLSYLDLVIGSLNQFDLACMYIAVVFFDFLFYLVHVISISVCYFRLGSKKERLEHRSSMSSRFPKSPADVMHFPHHVLDYVRLK